MFGSEKYFRFSVTALESLLHAIKRGPILVFYWYEKQLKPDFS
jgi:hypothetical protein